MVSFALHSVGVSAGIAIGRAQLVSLALREVRHELETLRGAMAADDVPGEFGAFIDVHWMILNDPTLSEVPKRIRSLRYERLVPVLHGSSGGSSG